MERDSTPQMPEQPEMPVVEPVLDFSEERAAVAEVSSGEAERRRAAVEALKRMRDRLREVTRAEPSDHP